MSRNYVVIAEVDALLLLIDGTKYIIKYLSYSYFLFRTVCSEFVGYFHQGGRKGR